MLLLAVATLGALDRARLSALHTVWRCCALLDDNAGAPPTAAAGASSHRDVAFWQEGADGVAGGVEFGFMSTTHQRAEASEYAQGHAATLLEMEQGLVDRGADLSWLSQYPHEKEVLFPPLTGLQALGSHVDGKLLGVPTPAQLAPHSPAHSTAHSPTHSTAHPLPRRCRHPQCCICAFQSI